MFGFSPALWTVLTGLILTGAALAQPTVVNPSFEVDKFDKPPGLAKNNGDKITGWTFKGNVGVNPCRTEPGVQGPGNSPFFDNGRAPHGRQVVFMQNKCVLSQMIPGFKAGQKYVVTYYENARRGNFFPETPPRITVTLGGQTIVSLHPVSPVEASGDRTLPFDFVESAPFIAPADGSFELVFTTTEDCRVTVLLDQVAIK